MKNLQARADAAVIDHLPNAYAAVAADDVLEERFARADMKNLQARTDALDVESSSWASGLSESFVTKATVDATTDVKATSWVRQLSDASTAAVTEGELSDEAPGELISTNIGV